MALADPGYTLHYKIDATMSAGGYKIRDQSAVHYLSFAVVEWIDVFKGQYTRI